MNIVAIIQARTSSKRLPQKVLKPLPYGSETTALEQVIKRLSKSECINKIVVATSNREDDLPIIDLCQRLGVAAFAGSLENVLSRYYLAAKEQQADVVVRITGDCPCIDARVVDYVIQAHIDQKADFTSNAIERTFPHGIDIGVMNFKALEEAYNEASLEYEKEHVTAFFYKTHPDRYKVQVVNAPTAYEAPHIRLTLDTPEDYTFLCAIYDQFSDDSFNLDDILSILQQKPWLLAINSEIVQKKVHTSLEEELNELKRICQQQDLERAFNWLKAQ